MEGLVSHGNIDGLKLLLNGASMHDMFDCARIAIKYKRIEILEYLISIGLDVNYFHPNHRETLMFISISYHRLDIIDYLVKHNVIITEMELDYASYMGNIVYNHVYKQYYRQNHGCEAQSIPTSLFDLKYN